MTEGGGGAYAGWSVVWGSDAAGEVGFGPQIKSGATEGGARATEGGGESDGGSGWGMTEGRGGDDGGRAGMTGVGRG